MSKSTSVKHKSKKLGRPCDSPEPRDENINIRLNKTELESLKNYVWRYDTSISDVIRDLMMIHSIIPES